MTVAAPALTWTQESPDLWRRSDNAYVQRGWRSLRRPWFAVDQWGHNLSGRLYADFDMATGATRTFSTAAAAMKAMDDATKGAGVK